jgi:hypothetical protein
MTTFAVSEFEIYADQPENLNVGQLNRVVRELREALYQKQLLLQDAEKGLGDCMERKAQLHIALLKSQEETKAAEEERDEARCQAQDARNEASLATDLCRAAERRIKEISADYGKDHNRMEAAEAALEKAPAEPVRICGDMWNETDACLLVAGHGGAHRYASEPVRTEVAPKHVCGRCGEARTIAAQSALAGILKNKS